MITVEMHEAQIRFAELVKDASRGDEVVICEDGKPVARLSSAVVPRGRRNLEPDPALRPILAPSYDPAEPLAEDEWPRDCR
ncbi:type II toxin-antitoxin system prevent-host-death family antitoxin [Luteolibacter flavescens]|uniref:Type II toxin-antitoxin system prevent-host-death family antitoxin n=1 Tax=Luteolibacter flavescens TaxID=1859460 RepID=A0ABT3FRT1_9BACT|nr:type II toxin-antitoxin system prevent-host-death family antitoxin [Luteolibacter flavescens]MCW1886283.1 type II toxin-antitoxin system prevent-host-death family antitoxin [Luteolibacter flavescens]